MWELKYIDILGEFHLLLVASGFIAASTAEVLRRYGYTVTLEFAGHA